MILGWCARALYGPALPGEQSCDVVSVLMSPDTPERVYSGIWDTTTSHGITGVPVYHMYYLLCTPLHTC